MPRRAPNPAALAIYQLQQQFGWRRAVWILDFLGRWAIAVRANGWEPITAEQFGEHWRVGRATAFREQARWRDLFPDEMTPNDRVIRARAEYERLVEEQGKEPSKGDVAALLGTLPA